MKKTALGPLVCDAGKGIGCRHCMLACPYQVPRYQWTKLAPYVKKCDLCSERVKPVISPRARKPAQCQASIFGDREELIAEAWNRIRSDSRYVSAIYGLQEAGGGSVLFVSDVEFEKLGFKPVPTAPDGEQQASRAGVGQAPAAPCGDEASALQDIIFLAKALTGR